MHDISSRVFASTVLTLTLAFSLTSAQPTSDFSLRRTAFSASGAGKGSIARGSFSLGLTVGEAGVVGVVNGGSFHLGEGFWSDMYRVQVTDTSELLDGSIQLVNSMSPNFPNPFDDATTIFYTVARPAPVRLTLYDVTGRKVTDLVDKTTQPSGRYRVRWSGRDDSGTPVASGVYFYRLSVGPWSESRKMLKVRS